MHINMSSDDNINLLLRKLAQAEGIENTFDISEVSDAISMLDSMTASTDFHMPKLENGTTFEQFSWVQSAKQSSIP